MNLNPSTQINLFEHKDIFNQLYKLYKNDNLPNKILLSGEKGIGKSTLAYHLISFLSLFKIKSSFFLISKFESIILYDFLLDLDNFKKPF